METDQIPLNHKTDKNYRKDAENLWIRLLSKDVWCNLDLYSRNNLIESKILEQRMYKDENDGSVSILSMLKAVEKELEIAFFLPWVDLIKKSNFTIIDPTSQKEQKRKRIYTMTKTAANEGRCITFGVFQIFIDSYLSDKMDDNTDLYRNIREQINDLESYKSGVKEIFDIINKKEPNSNLSIIDMRNKSAHPYTIDNVIDLIAWIIKTYSEGNKLLERIIKIREFYKTIDLH